MSYSASRHGPSFGQHDPRQYHRQVVAAGAAPEHSPGTEAFRRGLAAHAQYQNGDGESALDRAVGAFRTAVDHARGDQANAATYANSLGVALLDRYRLLDRARDLHAALDHFLVAHEDGRRDTFESARALRNLYGALSDLTARAVPGTADSGPDGGPDSGPDSGPGGERPGKRRPTLEELRRQLGRTPGVPLLERVRSAYESGRAAADADGPAAGYPDLALTVGLLPVALWGSRRRKLDELATLSGVGPAAAGCAIAAGEPARAVELLELGRAVMWEQDLKALPSREVLRGMPAGSGGRGGNGQRGPDGPQLAERMDAVHGALSRLDPPAAGPGGSVRPSAKGDPRMDADRWGYPWRNAALGAAFAGDPRYPVAPADWSPGRLHLAWSGLSAEAQRLLPHRALRQPDYLHDIRPAADEGPVVYVNVSPWRCDALIVAAEHEEPAHVPLPRVTAAEAEHRAERYLRAMTHDGADREDVVRDLLEWLYGAVVSPVLTALRQLAPSSGRMWWIPTGPLTTLPLHAAAFHGEPSRSNAHLLPVSSYTPTAGALRRARLKQRRKRRVLGAARRHLLVTPDAQALPGAARTHAHLDRLLPRSRRTVLAGPDATRDRVGAALPRHVWTHFDCHAEQDLDDPLASHLTLHDGALTVFDLADLPYAQAEFAFLAACTTAAGGSRVRDEWVSLAAALMYAEFPTVIGTLWPVPDGPTARVAQDVYGGILPDTARRFLRLPLAPSRHHHDRSASALHHALLTERARRPDHPSAWVSFVHYGA